MTTFLVLYRGHTVGEAKMVGLTADPTLIAYVAAKMLQAGTPHDGTGADETDAVLAAVEQGRSAALTLISNQDADAD